MGPYVQNLTFNFRTHQAVLELAARIVDAMVTFYPETTDRLPREYSNQDGAKPLLLAGIADDEIMKCFCRNPKDEYKHAAGNASVAAASQVHTGNKKGDNFVLTPSQVILVKSVDRKKELMRLFGNRIAESQIKTIGESKGLEWQDVMLWKLFEDSAVDKRIWFYLYNENRHRRVDRLQQKIQPNIREIMSNKTAKTLPSEGEGCALWGTELKELYVAVTRAKRRLIFAEPNKGGNAANQAMLMLHVTQNDNVLPLESMFLGPKNIVILSPMWHTSWVLLFCGIWTLRMPCTRSSTGFLRRRIISESRAKSCSTTGGMRLRSSISAPLGTSSGCAAPRSTLWKTGRAGTLLPPRR